MALQSDESNMDAAQKFYFNGDVLITSWHLMSVRFRFLMAPRHTYTYTVQDELISILSSHLSKIVEKYLFFLSKKITKNCYLALN